MVIFILLAILNIWLFGDNISFDIKVLIYNISILTKELIIFIVPFLVFGLSFRTAKKLAFKATIIILASLLLLCVSNFITVLFGFLIGNSIYYNIDFSIGDIINDDVKELTVYYHLPIKNIIGNQHALVLGILFGIITAMNPKKNIFNKLGILIDKFVSYTLFSFNILTPIFILGFIVKMENDGTISSLLENYGFILLIITPCAIIYLFGYHFISIGSINLFSYIKKMTTPIFIGFTSMSSLAAAPFTIKYLNKNTKNSNLVTSILPIISNIHLMGDCIFIPALSCILLKNFNIDLPSFHNYLIFTMWFVIAKFSVAAVPGGGIIVMLPIIKQYLDFDDIMLSAILTSYIVLDPIITSINILGNGLLSHLIDKFTMYSKRD